jgi:hypothetical protein
LPIKKKEEVITEVKIEIIIEIQAEEVYLTAIKIERVVILLMMILMKKSDITDYSNESLILL